MRPLLQDRKKSEARRLQDQKLRKAREQQGREENMRRLAELFESVQRREDEVAARDAELRAEHGGSNYRPDETDDQWATDWERDFEESTREWERFG